ncbi:MAG: pentapeptide repeat-containing protein [Verrucomicrobia bacterium]|nr:pentapeptide repeat-containing protein [Verrucomicrobiota bacterium]
MTDSLRRCANQGCDNLCLLPWAEAGTEGNSDITQFCSKHAKEEFASKNGAHIDQDWVSALSECLRTRKATQRLFLFDAECQGARFEDLDLQRSLFLRCDLSRASFCGANLKEANFLGSLLNNADLSNSTLEGACLMGVQANFSLVANSNLCGVTGGMDRQESGFPNVLKDTSPDSLISSLENAWKHGPRLQKDKGDEGPPSGDRTIRQLEMKEAVLRASDLTNANLIDAIMSGTALDYTRLQGADFSSCHLEDCSFSHSSLGNTTFANAQLDRADFSACFTPDPAEIKDTQSSTVIFDEADMDGGSLASCYFFCASLRNVHARRLDCRAMTLGPGSTLSGDFSNSRFGYADLIGCTLGEDEMAINLRDSDLSHIYAVEVYMVCDDMDSSCFERARFECREDFALTLRRNNGNGRNARADMILASLCAQERRQTMICGKPCGEKAVIQPAAVSFRAATLNVITFEDIYFLAADFSNSLTELTKDSNVCYDSCDFDNAVIGLPLQVQMPEVHQLFWACSFRNSMIIDYDDIKEVRKENSVCMIFRGCRFQSSAFLRKETTDTNEPDLGADAGSLKFIECTFEQTELHHYFAQSLKQAVLRKCRFLDGQHFGFFSKMEKNRELTQRQVERLLDSIVSATQDFADPKNGSDNGEDQKKSDRQFLWNMFAQSFGALALVDLQSFCLVRLKDVELLDHCTRFSRIFPVCQQSGPSALRLGAECTAILAAALFGSAVMGGWTGKLLGLLHEAGSLSGTFWESLVFGVFALAIPLWWMRTRTFSDTHHASSKPDSCIEQCNAKRVCAKGRSVRGWLASWTPSYEWRTIWARSVYLYGERATHALSTWAVVIGVFALLYFSTGWVSQSAINLGLGGKFNIVGGDPVGSIFSTENPSAGLVNSIYFSVVTFTTLGFGDLHPLHGTKFFAAMEACIGAVLMALFVLSFARRTAAR